MKKSEVNYEVDMSIPGRMYRSTNWYIKNYGYELEPAEAGRLKQICREYIKREKIDNYTGTGSQYEHDIIGDFLWDTYEININLINDRLEKDQNLYDEAFKLAREIRDRISKV